MDDQVSVRTTALTLALALTSATGASGQIAESRIVLATVADAQARPLTALTEDDFVVDESGEPREILSVRLADYPIVLLVDNARTPAPEFEAVRAAAARFVARIGARRAVAVGALGHPATMLTTFDTERAAVARALETLAPAATGDRDLLDGLIAGARLIRSTEAPFSAIVVVSGANMDVPAPARGGLPGQLPGGRMAVHVVARSPRTAAVPGTLGDTLRVLAGETRGQFTTVFSALSYQPALDRVVDRLAAEMMIEFLTPSGSTAGDVQVGVRVPGARVTGLGVSR